MARPLWCAIHLPQLPLEAQTLEAPAAEAAAPSVLAGRHRVLLANAAAATVGIAPGMKLATAHALIDNLQVLARDLAAEARQLRLLGWRLLRFTPNVAEHTACEAEHPARLHADDTISAAGLLLELGGSLKLFKGSEALLVELFTTLAATGLSWQAGLGHTPLAAWALSHAPAEISLTTLQRSQSRSTAETAHLFRQALETLPLQSLPLHPALKEKLLAPGFRTLADLTSLPRPALGKRFSKALLHWLERLLGERPDPREPITPPARFHSRADFDEPVAHQQQLLPVMARQLQELENYLHWRHQAVRSVRWQLFDHQGEAPALVVRRAHAGADADTWLTLADRHLERWPLRAPVLSLLLTTSRPEKIEGHSEQLFPDPGERASCELLLERLASLPGLHLQRLHRCDDHLPEQAQGLTDPLLPAADTPPQAAPHARQPLWLFDPPQPLACDRHGRPRWRGAALSLVGADQRLSSHWWQQPQKRAYFIARHPTEQHLCWVYRAADGWFLHGLF
ncbi:Y-family DNA polymerase [Alcanivorax quisquiliarum]|uniref:DNA polymerase Y family protein n=1 Tax=Alcanivorax quisquiliarum TaxID=2933565 RepID=A0ABT0E9C8_9GAMM|nr:DNA polymerase Y family protein [Alcanivorax quisquiliarum]MCK0538365.1 DNA polymerase Y family protein [Alcanivorax quisquiliarum]